MANGEWRSAKCEDRRSKKIEKMCEEVDGSGSQKWREASRHATDMRTSCGERGVDASSTAFRSPRAAENQSRAPAWTGTGTGYRLPKFANFVKCRASRMRTRC
jgi:hypothetical protein